MRLFLLLFALHCFSFYLLRRHRMPIKELAKTYKALCNETLIKIGLTQLNGSVFWRGCLRLGVISQTDIILAPHSHTHPCAENSLQEAASPALRNRGPRREVCNRKGSPVRTRKRCRSNQHPPRRSHTPILELR